MASPVNATLKGEPSGGLLQLTLHRQGRANALNPDLTETLIETITQSKAIRRCALRGACR